MSDRYLAHHGILGQKWGVRRFQNKNGSLTQSGKQRYSYTSEKTRKLKASGNKEAYNKSKELDRKISEKNASLTKGDRFVRALLVGPASRRLTYDIARESGYSKGRSWLKANLDLSVPDFAGAFVGGATTGVITGIGSAGNNPKRAAAAAQIGGIAGQIANYQTNANITRNGGEMSLRQNSLRNKYISGRTPNEKRKRRESVGK